MQKTFLERRLRGLQGCILGAVPADGKSSPGHLVSSSAVIPLAGTDVTQALGSAHDQVTAAKILLGPSEQRRITCLRTLLSTKSVGTYLDVGQLTSVHKYMDYSTSTT